MVAWIVIFLTGFTAGFLTLAAIAAFVWRHGGLEFTAIGEDDKPKIEEG